MDYLFVYGTLLQYFENKVWSPLKGFIQLEGLGQINAAELYDLGEYPGLIKMVEGQQTVTGEVYRISQNTESVLAALDEYEGPEYSREQHNIMLKNGTTMSCWVYVYQHQPQPKHIKIKQGDYIAYIRDQVNNG